jgi:Ca2+-binding EF-hand superfamily protein
MRKQILTIALGVAGLTGFLYLGAPAARADAEKGAMFARMDTNADGTISADEFAAAQKEIFVKMDTNGDGKLSIDEMKVATEKHERMMGKSGGHETVSVTEKMKVMDLNDDGYVSEDEFVAASKVIFDKMDTNHDGTLTKEELKAGREKIKSKMEEKGKSENESSTPLSG